MYRRVRCLAGGIGRAASFETFLTFENSMTQNPSTTARGPFSFDEMPDSQSVSPIASNGVVPSAASSEQTKSSPKYRVLIIDDDVPIARMIAANLQKAGLGFECVTDGAAGLHAFHEKSPHLVLLDLMLPGMNGFQICSEIRKTSSAPVIMMTARVETTHQMRGFRLGADDYVLKPFDPQLLVARIIAHLRRVYRYQQAESPTPTRSESLSQRPSGFANKEVVKTVLPEGWASCGTCDYMGPLKKFPRRTNGTGENALACPHCGTEKSVQFVLS